MLRELTFFICGGDLRQINLAQQLLLDGYKVIGYGFETTPQWVNEQAGSLDDIADADYLVLPLPCLVDDEYINAPFANDKIKIKDVLSKIRDKQIAFCGKIPANVRVLADEYKVHIEDYFEREELAVMNAVPTYESKEQSR